MTSIILWISLSLLIVASALPKKHMVYRFLVGGAGWIFFALHWATQSSYFVEIVDYVNVVLVLLFFHLLHLHRDYHDETWQETA